MGLLRPLKGYWEKEIIFRSFCLLREPNCPDEKQFWFKEDAVKKAYGRKDEQDLKGAEKRYFYILSVLAQKAMGVGSNEKFVLDRCAYMNIHPFRGGKTCSKEYKNILNEINQMSIELCPDFIPEIERNSAKNVEIAANRISIIKRAVDNGIKNILTTGDIYDALKKIWKVPSDAQEKYSIEYKYDENDKEFKKKADFNVCYIGENKQTRLISFWHPSHTYIYYKALEEIEIPYR